MESGYRKSQDLSPNGASMNPLFLSDKICYQTKERPEDGLEYWGQITHFVLVSKRHLMQFKASDGVAFEIPTEWWERTKMPEFAPSAPAYAVDPTHPHIDVPISEIAPLRRKPGLAGYSRDGFDETRMISILCAFCSQAPLPPVQVNEYSSDSYRYKLYDGLHRFYASVAAGFSHLPIEVVGDLQAFFEAEAADEAEWKRTYGAP
jgi:hypothetical protein